MSAATSIDDGGSSAEGSVGRRIRRRRKAARMTLRQLALATGLAEGFLSQLERGLSGASVSTLQKVSAALGLSVGDLFNDLSTAKSSVVRLDHVAGRSFGIDAHKLRLTPTTFDHFEAFVGTFGPEGSTGTEPHSHGESEETLLVLEGVVVLTLDGVDHRLGRHDSISYGSDTPHRVKEALGDSAKVLWMISPPSY